MYVFVVSGVPRGEGSRGDGGPTRETGGDSSDRHTGPTVTIIKR